MKIIEAEMANIEQSINKIIEGLEELKKSLVAAQTVAPAPVVEMIKPAPVVEINDFESLKATLYSDKWPESVNKNLICDPESESDKCERGKGIIELMIEEDLKGLKFLDIGCGEGHCAYLSTDYGSNLSVGYDINKNDKWEKFESEKENLVLTNDFNVVKTNGPYDVVVIFDVIDHITSEDPVSLLSKAKSVLAENGKIYMRCHPFASRHGTHLYHDINKAYIHLVFKPDEIRMLIPESKYEEHSIRVIYPIRTYGEYIEKSGLKIASRREITDKVEPFFKLPVISNRIISNLRISNFPEFQMGIQFVDYTLTH